MILYHGTSKENAESIKRNGFSLEYTCKNLGSTYGKAIYFTNCYKTAKCYAGQSGEVLTVDIKNVNYLKLDKDYSPTDKKHIREIKSIIMYVMFNSNKNCLLNYNGNEYIFFGNFRYRII
jgi:hypothetical protein